MCGGWGVEGRRLELAWLLPCPRTPKETCHILRTDRKTENTVSVDYVERVNRAIDHIVRGLAQPLRLEEVSEAAGFSPFHFHRVLRRRARGRDRPLRPA